MADATTLICAPDESLKKFNKRIAAACGQEGAFVTSVNLDIVDGQPMVTLFSDIAEATEEDVAAGEAEKVGDPIFQAGPLVCAVSKVSAVSKDQAEKSEVHLEKIYDLAEEGLEDVSHESATYWQWVESPSGGEPHYLPVRVSYVLVSWGIPYEDTDEETDDEEEAEGVPGGEPGESIPDEGDVLDAEKVDTE